MSAPSSSGTDSGAKAPPPDLLAAWPRRAQVALASLVLLTLALITAHVVRGRLSDARPTTVAAEKAPTAPLDLNKADFAQLRQLPEVGDKLAAAIIDCRRGRGGFGSVDELMSVPGIGRAKLERLRPWLYVEDEEAPPDEPGTAPVTVTVKKPATGGTTRTRKGEGLRGVLDLNTATEDQLRQVDGLGPVLARRIVEARQKQPFRAVEDLLKIPFLKQKTLDKVRPYVAVSPPPSAAD
jgi:competence protein ComEA